MYLLLAAIVLLILFAASYGGRSTWIALASATLSVLLVGGCAFIANAGSAGPYFTALSAQSPALLQGGIQDLAYAAERTAAALAQNRQRPARVAIVPAPTAPVPPETVDKTDSDWIDLSWLDPVGWLGAAANWVNPWNGSGDPKSGKPITAPRTAADAQTGRGAPQAPRAQAPQAPMPTVRAMMHPDAKTTEQRAAAAPSYRIVTVEPPQDGTGAPPPAGSPGTPVQWLAGVSPPAGTERVLLSGTNASSVPLEDIQATLKPDSDDAPLGIGNVVLSLRVEGPDGTLAPSAAVPPGARFHLQAEDLSADAARQLGGAIVSFAYSLDGRRRTSIMYLKQAALNDATMEPQ